MRRVAPASPLTNEPTPEQAARDLEHRLQAFRVAKYGAQALRDLYERPWWANSGRTPDQTRLP